MKLALTAASLLLVMGGAVACGGDDGDSGSDGGGSASGGGGTSVADFCGAFEDFQSALISTDPNADTADLIKKFKDEADKLEDAGTPDDIPDDAQEGFDLVLGAIDDLPDDATEEDLQQLDSEFSEDDNAKVDAFDEYLAKTCPDLGTGGGDTASSGPSPSDPASVEASPSE